MYSAYKLEKLSDNVQPWSSPFPIWIPSVFPCPVLTVASWPAYRSLRRQSQVVWYSHLFKNFPQFVLIHTVKGFGIVNTAKVDVFWNSLAFLMIQWILATRPLVPLPFLKPAWMSGSSQFMYCWSLAWRILFSCSTISYSLWYIEQQHARLSCPSLSPGVCSNSCPWSQWFTTEIYFLTVLDAGDFKIKLHQSSASGECSLPGLQIVTFFVFTWLFLSEREWEPKGELSGVFSYKYTNASQKRNYLLKALFPNIVILGVRNLTTVWREFSSLASSATIFDLRTG